MDADLQHPPEKLPELCGRLDEGIDLAIASRYTSSGGVEGWSPYRKLVSHGATFLAHVLLPETRTVRDPVSGFFAFNRESMKGIKISTRGYKILLELLHQTRNTRLKIAEVPFIFAARRRGKSKLASGEIVRYVHLLLDLAKLRVTLYLGIGLGILVTIACYYLFLKRS